MANSTTRTGEPRPLKPSIPPPAAADAGSSQTTRGPTTTAGRPAVATDAGSTAATSATIPPEARGRHFGERTQADPRNTAAFSHEPGRIPPPPPPRGGPPPRGPQQARKPQRGIGDLLKELRDESQTLFRQEVALAKTELSEKASQAGRNAGWSAAGGVALALGGLLLLLALANIISAIFELIGVNEWASGAIGYALVGATVAGIGYALLKKGLDGFKHQSFTPERTLSSLKEDSQWLKNRAK